jgi:hypothetical protein
MAWMRSMRQAPIRTCCHRPTNLKSEVRSVE